MENYSCCASGAGDSKAKKLGITRIISRSKEHEYMELPWLPEARCRTEDPELFFPVGNTGPAVDQIEQAKAICRECKVSNLCLEYAIKENQDNGIWGGLSEDERKSLKRKYARARRSA